jgi:hypothetical protein
MKYGFIFFLYPFTRPPGCVLSKWQYTLSANAYKLDCRDLTAINNTLNVNYMHNKCFKIRNININCVFE